MQTDWTGNIEGAAAIINEATNKGAVVTVNGKSATRTFARQPAEVVNGDLLVYITGDEVRQNRVGGSTLWVREDEPLTIEMRSGHSGAYEPADTTDRGPDEYHRGGFGNWQVA